MVKGSITGGENLEIMEDAVRYLAHVGALVASELPRTGSLVEFGAGNGLQTSAVLDPTERLVCVEIDQESRDALALKGYRTAQDLAAVASESLAGLFSINCLEHIEDDRAMLAEFRDRLSRGGTLVLYLPAMPVLFSSMDRAVGHYRRYTADGLRSSLREAGFEVRVIRYVDSLGVLPSLLYRILPGASGKPSPASVRVYDRVLFPISRVLDRLLWRWVGKNLFAVAVRR